jgi:triacylglycerol esterase/lipase EstA (alpha/beta hydrolase family)
MASRFIRLLLIFQACAVAALAVLLVRAWHVGAWQAILLAFGTLVLVRLSINLNNFRVARRYGSPTPPPYQLNARQAARLFVNEFAASMMTTSWTMAFNTFGTRTATSAVGLPVLLIHGYGCNSGYWHQLSKRLAAERITHHAVDLEPILASLDDYVPLISDAIETLCKISGRDKVVIVAHSMGGLVARAYLRDHGAARVAKVVTIGTPHRGTGLANLGRGMNSRQMEWTGNGIAGVPSAWLRKLEQSEDAALRALIVSIYSHHDNIISPQTSSHLAGAVNVELHGIGHVALASDRQVHERVIAEIHAASLAQVQPPRAAA